MDCGIVYTATTVGLPSSTPCYFIGLAHLLDGLLKQPLCVANPIGLLEEVVSLGRIY